MKYRVKTDLLEGVEKGDTYEASEHSDYYYSSNSVRLHKSVIERNPEWFEPVEDVKVGQYWRYKDDVVRVIDVDHPFCAYHSITESRDNTDIGKCNVSVLHNTAVLLSDDTIEEHLIAEAKRRGYKKGVRVKICQTDIVSEINQELKYRSVDDSIVGVYGGYTIYNEGQWGEIIDETPSIGINGHKAEFHDDYVQFGCAKIHKNHIREIHRDLMQYANVQSYSVDGVGECKSITGVSIGKDLFSRDQIKQIAEYYQ